MLFHFDSDLDLVALVDGGQKSLLALCQIVHKAFQLNVPDIGLQHHQRTPMTRMAEGSEVEMFCRNNLTICAKTMAFFPDSLDDQTMAQTQLKRATFGAIFNGHRDSLPQSAEYGVIWEVTLDKNPPAQIKALKPKFWLKGKLPMKADHVYKIG